MATILPRIGAHVSTAGGLAYGIENAVKIGASCIQIFGASPRQWKAPMPNDEVIERFKNKRQTSGIGPVFLHASYLVNLAHENEQARQWSVASLTDHLKIAKAIEAQGLIFHIGSRQGLTDEEAHKRVVAGMQTILTAVPGDTQLIMENAAGVKKVGGTAAELGLLRKMVDSPRVAVCWDTAHAFEAGIAGHFTEEDVTRMCDEIEKHIGWEQLVAIHANDSKTEFASQHDRHENIGEGFIGLDGFRNLARDTRLWTASWLLEVPGTDKKGPDRKNIETLRSCFPVE